MGGSENENEVNQYDIEKLLAEHEYWKIMYSANESNNKSNTEDNLEHVE